MNEHELESMRNVFNNLRKKIEPLSESPKILKLRERVTKIRKDSIDNNEELLQTARKSFKENDIDLFYAEDDKQARDILLNLINEEIASNDNINPDEVFIAKSKSNTLREINASEFLEENGMVIVDTDLGDRILQLKKGDNSPVHPTGPASHLTVQDIA
ncbi:MAG: lactate utilization protein, partial [Methanobrevibacter sp.]|nr:lactate utilization protein [Methanobrevibacter sp.]